MTSGDTVGCKHGFSSLQPGELCWTDRKTFWPPRISKDEGVKPSWRRPLKMGVALFCHQGCESRVNYTPCQCPLRSGHDAPWRGLSLHGNLSKEDRKGSREAAQQTLAPPLASGMMCPAGKAGLRGGPVCSQLPHPKGHKSRPPLVWEPAEGRLRVHFTLVSPRLSIIHASSH